MGFLGTSSTGNAGTLGARDGGGVATQLLHSEIQAKEERGDREVERESADFVRTSRELKAHELSVLIAEKIPL